MRRTARVLVLDEDDRLLLMKTHWDSRVDPPRWLTPGGGLDAGETPHDAAVRELFEETGLRVETLGPPVWHHEIAMPAGYTTDAVDATYYLLRTAHFDPVDDNYMPNEFDDVVDVRWFTPRELAVSDDVFDPEDVRSILRAVLH